ncbi:hypothetical protein ACFW6R_08995 [Streptomyces albidoflavus]
MGSRDGVFDYAGEAVEIGDLVIYAARVGNRVRVSDAVVEEIRWTRAAGRILPEIKVQPTGVDSGWGTGARKTLRTEWISPEHMRLKTAGFANG